MMRRVCSTGVALVLAGGVTVTSAQRPAQNRTAPPPTPATAPAEAATPDSRFTSTLTLRGPSSELSAPVFRGAGRAVFLPGFPFVWTWDAAPSDAAARVPPLSPLTDAPIGGVQLDVLPWRAQVYVDGTHVGRVDDFKGYYRHLAVASGPHQIVIVEPGYQPLVLDLVVPAGRTTTYRGTLRAGDL